MAEKCWAKMIVSQLWLLLSSSSGHEIHLYYRGWKRAIFFSIGKNFNNSRLPELVTLDRRQSLCFVIRPEQAIPEDKEMSIVR
jgi:hypothetical protein